MAIWAESPSLLDLDLVSSPDTEVDFEEKLVL